MGNCLVPSSKEENPRSSRASEAAKFPKKVDSPLAPSPSPRILECRKSTFGNICSPRTEREILSSPNLKAFSYNELKNATRNFRHDFLLGEGGFGHVYKGWIDSSTLSSSTSGSRIAVAIKKLKAKGFQGHNEWLTEVNYLGQLRHPNLVKLIGYCLDGENHLLVYEFMSRGSLENHLFRRGTQPLSWDTRIKVAIDSARGLTVLHESQVIYRDFKPGNILLDSGFNAKLSDFGFAIAGPSGDDSDVSARVMGTFGYAAPEYIGTGRLSARCDVYSYGVVLLELLAGRRAVERNRVDAEQDLVEWARPYCNKRKLYRIMDPRLEGQYPQKGAYMAAVLASKCVSRDPKARPVMSEVLTALEAIPVLHHSVHSSPLTGQDIVPSPARRSPYRINHLPSPLNITPRGSALVPHRKSTHGQLIPHGKSIQGQPSQIG